MAHSGEPTRTVFVAIPFGQNGLEENVFGTNQGSKRTVRW